MPCLPNKKNENLSFPIWLQVSNAVLAQYLRTFFSWQLSLLSFLWLFFPLNRLERWWVYAGRAARILGIWFVHFWSQEQSLLPFTYYLHLWGIQKIKCREFWALEQRAWEVLAVETFACPLGEGWGRASFGLLCDGMVFSFGINCLLGFVSLTIWPLSVLCREPAI